MESIVLLTICILALLVSCNAQFNFNLPFEGNECALGKLLDPVLAQTLKSKYPKKYSSKLGFQKNMALDSKFRLGAEKLLAKHLKNLNSVNQDLQKIYQQQHFLMQPLTVANQASLSPQQQYLSNIQNHYDARRRFTFCPSSDSQISALLQATDQHFQSPNYQLTGMQSVTSLRPQQALY